MIPTEVSIDGITWTIDVSDSMDDSNWGETRPSDCRILLSADIKEDLRESIFWHELVHAIFKARSFRLNRESNADDLEEQVATFLGPALFSFFRSNVNIEWTND